MANEPDRINSGALATIMVLIAFATLGVALVVTALVRDEEARLQAEAESKADRPYRALVAEQRGQLNDQPGWADRSKGLVSIPIDTAMKLTVEDLRRNPALATPGNGAGGAGAEDEASEEGEPGDAEGEAEAEGATPAPEAPAPTPEAPTPEAPAPQAPTPAPQAPAPRAPAPQAPAPQAPAPQAPAPQQ